jgi:hypothetical protein
MERTVPSTESEEIELYTRTYYSLLRSTAEVQIRTLEEVHTGMNSLLHRRARDPYPDMSAFIYSLLRLPESMPQVKLVVLGQSLEVFSRGGYPDVFSWKEVYAQARRRRCFFNGTDTLACFIASRSDIDDLIPVLTAYQIEWNKLHHRLQRLGGSQAIAELYGDVEGWTDLPEQLEISQEDFDRLYAIWDEEIAVFLGLVAEQPRRLRVRLLSGSLNEYRRVTRSWWEQIEEKAPELRERPVYFVSSNTHSISNLLSGYSLRHRESMIAYLHQSANQGLLNEWQDIQSGRVPSSPENFFYYVFGKFMQSRSRQGLNGEQRDFEEAIGIRRVRNKRYFDVEAQVIDLSKLDPPGFDRRLSDGNADAFESWLKESDALILNVDYPLGLAAYNILAEVAEQVGSIAGVYVMGKAATLNGVVGDVMIPNVIHDAHSQNTYLIPNCFTAADVAPFLRYGTVLDNQKAVTVQGTFLQNADYMDVFYREGYTDIEMEAGAYCSAVFEMVRPTRHPVNEIVNMYGMPFDLGIVHYASDTPLSKGKNLGAGSLSYFGMDSTYAVTLSILRRIFQIEQQKR